MGEHIDSARSLGRARFMRTNKVTLPMLATTIWDGHTLVTTSQSVYGVYHEDTGYQEALLTLDPTFNEYVPAVFTAQQGDPTKPIEGFVLSLTTRFSLPLDFTIEGRPYLAVNRYEIDDPYDDWAPFFDVGRGVAWGTDVMRSEVDADARPFPGGRLPHGYVWLRVRGTYTGDPVEIVGAFYTLFRRG